MRLHAQKQRQSEWKASPQPSRLIQRTIAKQAIPGVQRAHAEDRQGLQPGTSSLLAATGFAHDFSLIPAHSREPVNLQAKLTVNSPRDIYEQEADRVADRVMRMPEAQLQRDCACGGGCSECQTGTGQPSRQQEQLQAKRVQGNNPGGDVAPPIVNEVLRSSGQPLDAQTRDFMESRFGQDFSRVRVHTDDLAVKSAQAIHARAYTIGRDIAFGEGQYSPHTLEGRRLLAHELTHIVHQTGGAERPPTLQRKEEGAAKSAKTAPFSVTFKGCDKSPFTPSFVELSVKDAFEKTRTSDCIRNESLRKDMLGAYNGLTVICDSDDVKQACAETKKGPKTIRIYRASFNRDLCPELEPLVFHEMVHVAERWNIISEGSLAYDCGESCYPGTDKKKRGNPLHCDYERGLVQFGGVSTGVTFPEKGAETGYLRLYVGVEKRGPILSFVRPSFGLGLSLIGVPSGESHLPSGVSPLVSLMSGLRIDPGKEGSFYFSLGGGPEIALRNEGPEVGLQVGAKFGYRWHVYDVSLDAGVEYDPRQKGEAGRMYTLGLSFQLAPKVRP